MRPRVKWAISGTATVPSNPSYAAHSYSYQLTDLDSSLSAPLLQHMYILYPGPMDCFVIMCYDIVSTPGPGEEGTYLRCLPLVPLGINRAHPWGRGFWKPRGDRVEPPSPIWLRPA